MNGSQISAGIGAPKPRRTPCSASSGAGGCLNSMSSSAPWKLNAVTPFSRQIAQNLLTEKRWSSTSRPPHSIAAITLVYRALMWNSGNAV